jgi:small-conductance mechanosensitive channel
MLLTIIFGGAAIVMTIFVFGLIFFAVKDMVPDILTGIFIRSSGFIKQGERIEVDGFRGQVKKIGLLTTQIKGQRETMKLQNSQIIRKVKILHK